MCINRHKSQISESCEHFSNTNQWGKNTHQEVIFLKEQTGEVISFYEIKPSKILSGIESVEFNNEHESIIKNLDSVKEKCKEFGLKPNTDQFGKCILNLKK